EALHQVVAQGAVAEYLLQIRLAHHAPAVRRAGEAEGHPAPYHRDVAVIRIAGGGDKGIGAPGNGLAHTRVRRPGGRIGEAALELGMLAHADRAPGGGDAILEVAAMAEGAVLDP